LKGVNTRNSTGILEELIKGKMECHLYVYMGEWNASHMSQNK
jgi:hypothetical protein